jgi:hypothetical protein
MPARRLRFPSWQRNIEIGDLVDLKTLPNGVHAAEWREQFTQGSSIDAIHFEVDVLRVAIHEPVAHPAADDQCASAGPADDGGDIGGEGERVCH